MRPNLLESSAVITQNNLQSGSQSENAVKTYLEGNIIPLSLAIAYSKRLADVTQPIVPLMKQTPSITVSTTAAARLCVAW